MFFFYHICFSGVIQEEMSYKCHKYGVSIIVFSKIFQLNTLDSCQDVRMVDVKIFLSRDVRRRW